VGHEILKKGGNAFDAAVAVAEAGFDVVAQQGEKGWFHLELRKKG
jgi:gamma-glutamyltranspeptidase